MSPQFVDFDANGHVDIVAGTFDGSPHVALGTAQGWRQPVHILDRNGERIVLNKFWNTETNKWDATKRCDVEEKTEDGQATSALAVDWDGDGDLDLLLGDHERGNVYLRTNEGSVRQNAFGLKNVPLRIGGKALHVPGTVTTMRLVDWNRDGLTDIACGSVGTNFGGRAGGAVYMYLNTSKKGFSLSEPLVLIPASQLTSTTGPERPDSGLYMDLADQDGDGDLDLIVGGYSEWTPKARPLSAKEKLRVDELKVKLAAVDQRLMALNNEMLAAIGGLDGDIKKNMRAEVLQAQQHERVELGEQRAPLQDECDQLVPVKKRVAYVWLYENLRGSSTR